MKKNWEQNETVFLEVACDILQRSTISYNNQRYLTTSNDILQ